MNRRTAIKSVLTLSAGIGITSYGGYKIFNYTQPANISMLHKHTNTIKELVDIIIPKTTTPSASEAHVHLFIISTLKNCKGKKNQKNFINGLLDLETYSLENFNCKFEKCSHQEKIKIVDYFKNKNAYSGLIGKVKRKLLGKSFFQILKSLTIQGYCTSEVGATKHLSYNYIPGRYIACTQLKENQKAWATL